MKKHCLFLCYILAPLFVIAQDASPQEEIQRDAIQLTARHLQKNEVVEELPTSLIDSIAQLLKKVLHSSFPQMSIIKNLDIHTQKTVDVYNIRFLASAEENWVKNYLANRELIPDALIFLFSNYEGLHLQLIQAGPIYCEFNLRSDYPMQMNNFGRQISKLPGIDMVMVGGNDENHNQNVSDIRLQRIANAWLISYCYGINNSEMDYVWQFSIEDLTGEVQIIAEQGKRPPVEDKNNSSL